MERLSIGRFVYFCDNGDLSNPCAMAGVLRVPAAIFTCGIEEGDGEAMMALRKGK